MGNQDRTTPKQGPHFFSFFFCDGGTPKFRDLLSAQALDGSTLAPQSGDPHPSFRGPQSGWEQGGICTPQCGALPSAYGVGLGVGLGVGSARYQRRSRGFRGRPALIPFHTCALRAPPAAPLVSSSRSSQRARTALVVGSWQSSQWARAAPLVCSSASSQRARAAQ